MENNIAGEPEKVKDEICFCGVPLSHHNPTCCGWENANVIYFPWEHTVPAKISSEETEIRYLLSTSTNGLKIAAKLFPVHTNATSQQPLQEQNEKKFDKLRAVLNHVCDMWERNATGQVKINALEMGEKILKETL